MQCRRCSTAMLETRTENHPASLQTWFNCPACDTIKMHTRPNPVTTPDLGRDEPLDLVADTLSADSVGL